MGKNIALRELLKKADSVVLHLNNGDVETTGGCSFLTEEDKIYSLRFHKTRFFVDLNQTVCVNKRGFAYVVVDYNFGSDLTMAAAAILKVRLSFFKNGEQIEQ